MTSGPRLVKPQAMSALWPITTPGTPENVKPATSNGHSLADGAAVQAHLHPDAGHADAEVRVVGQQRRAGLGVLAVDDPAVARPPVGGAVGGRTAAAEERRQPVERLAEARPAARAGQRCTPAAPGCGYRPPRRPARRRRRRQRPGRRSAGGPGSRRPGRARPPAPACGRPTPGPARSPRRGCP